MNITTDKQKFSKVLAVIGHVVPKRSYGPTSTEDKILVNGALIATDFNTYVRLEYPHEGEAGEAVFPFSGLKAAAKGKGPLSLGIYDRLAESGTTVLVAAGGMKWPAGDVASFPVAPKIKEGSPSIVVDGSELHEALSLGAIARAAEEGRYLFDHVLLTIEEGRLSVVTTDGRRMAVATIAAEGQDGRVLVTPAAVKVLKYLAAVPEGVRLTWGEVSREPTPGRYAGKLHAESSAGEAWFTTRDDAAFPDFRPHLEGRPRTPLATVNRKELLAACEGANEVATEHLRAVKFAFVGGIQLQVSVKSAGGEFAATITCGGAREATIYMDPEYLADGLKALKAETVNILASPDAPEEESIIVEAGILRYLVMPILID